MAPSTKTANRTTQQAAPQQAPQGNLPAKQEDKRPPIVQFRDYVNQRMITLEETLPPYINPTYFVSAIMVALQKKPSLLKCTFASIWNACVEAAKDGLLPDNKEGAIVPYGENADGKRVAELATWMPMIEGYRKKIFETGKVKSWEVQVVREKDEFEYELGDNAFIRHKPFVGTVSPGNVVGAYSIAKLATGETVREVMGAYDIMRVAAKSKAGNGPWKDPDFVPEMARKVVGRRHYKQLPHSRELSEMIARDDARFGLDDSSEEALPKPQSARRLTQREAFDTYAGAVDGGGQIIDHDETTGEVTDDDRADFQDQGAVTGNTSKAAASDANREPAQGASKGAGAGTGTASASAPTQQQNAAPTSPGASAEAGVSAEGTTQAAPASTTSQQDQQLEDEQIDGADRPWPPGATPTNEVEYERFLRTKLETFTKANEVAPWWNSQEQKDLRTKCKVVRFKELQDLAIARRKALP